MNSRTHILMATALALSAVQAQAESASSADADKLQAITVIGSPFKLGIPAEEIPQTVSSITAQDIDTRSYATVEEALAQVSSVQAGLAGRSGYDEFMIRGFSQSYYQFKNGLRLDPGYNQQEELYGLERIDVLKGPSSVEYGQIAPGGVVNLISKKPQSRGIREAAVEFGSFDYKRFAADIGDTIGGSNVWSFRVPFAFTDAGDFQNYVFSRRQYVAPTLAYRPDQRTELVIYTSYQNDDFRRSAAVPFELASRVSRSTYLGEPSLPAFTRPQTQFGYAFEHLFANEWTFKQNLRQTNYHERGTSIYGSSWTDSTFTPGYYYFDYQVSVFSLDNQIQKTLKSGSWEHDFLAGYDWLKYRSHTRGVGGETPSLDIVAPVYTPTVVGAVEDSPAQKLDQRGVYAQYRLKLANRYTLNLGARHSKISNDNYGVRSELSKNTYSAGLMILDIGGFSPFVSYSQSFEPINGWDPYLFDGNPPPKFSEGSQREAGVKWRSADGRQTAVASYFNIYQTNIYNYVGFGTAEGCAIDDNFCDAASDQRHKGFELEVHSQWSQSLDLQASFTHLDARIANTQLASATGAVGSRPFGIPANTVSATAIVHGVGFGLGATDLIVGVRHVGARIVNQSGEALAAFTVADIGAAYTLGKARFAASLKNVTGKAYLVGPYFGNVNYGAPRSLLVSVEYAW